MLVIFLQQGYSFRFRQCQMLIEQFSEFLFGEVQIEAADKFHNLVAIGIPFLLGSGGSRLVTGFSGFYQISCND
ncbi:hypothetical protein D3C75_1252590 [compost metagenome]